MQVLKFVAAAVMASANVATAEVVPAVRPPALLRLQLPADHRPLPALRPSLLEPVAVPTVAIRAVTVPGSAAVPVEAAAPAAMAAPAAGSMDGVIPDASAAPDPEGAVAAPMDAEAAVMTEPPAVSIEVVCDTLKAAAAANNLPLTFFLRLIWQESRFDPRAVSPAGAQGLAQFMPKVAAEKGLLDPFDPIQALPASARFLRDLRAQFGNLGLAAAAYNAGARRIQDWLAKRGTLPRETRDYVLKITGHAPERWLNTIPQASAFATPARAPCKAEEDEAVALIEPMPMPAEMLAAIEAERSARARADKAQKEAAAKSKGRAAIAARAQSSASKRAQLAAKQDKGSRREVAAKGRDSKLTARLKTKVQIITEERSPRARRARPAISVKVAEKSVTPQAKVASRQERQRVVAKAIAKPTRLASAR